VSEAVRAVSERPQPLFGLARFETVVFTWKPASMRVLEKAGFLREGILRKSVFGMVS
jgi:[ribosomal protein S5]-alanine N-acetyltransferase